MNSMPIFEVMPNVFSQEELNILQTVTKTEAGIVQWYGRTTFWSEDFTAKVAQNNITIDHPRAHICNGPIDKLTNLFIQTMKSFGESLEGREINLEIYLDRNEVSQNDSSKSGMFWHRDGITINDITINGERPIADYTLIVLLSDEKQWKEGNLRLQHGGRKITRTECENSESPIVVLKPRQNQGIFFKNSDAAHMVEPLIPLADSVQRDVLIITGKVHK